MEIQADVRTVDIHILVKPLMACFIFFTVGQFWEE